MLTACIEIDARVLPAGTIKVLAEIVRRNPGNQAFFVHILTSEGERTLRMTETVDVFSPRFRAQIASLVGEEPFWSEHEH